jgi:hypothetical protein
MKNLNLARVSVVWMALATSTVVAMGCGSETPGTSGSTGGTQPTNDVPAGDALTMDAAGYVPEANSAFGIHGNWYWYSDSDHGDAGKTQLTGVLANQPPYVPEQGMCITGTTPGGANDNYVTWGAGIGLNLNQAAADGGATAQVLSPAPRCFSVTLSADSTSPGGILGKLQQANPMPGTTANPAKPQEPPSILLVAGKATDVCIDNVKPPSWCTGSDHQPGDCADPAHLKNGVAGLQVQTLAGTSGGNLNLCVASVVPHD